MMSANDDVKGGMVWSWSGLVSWYGAAVVGQIGNEGSDDDVQDRVTR